MEHRHTVLVVEDDWDTRDALVSFLESSGIASASSVSNGAEALDHLRAGPRPCLILLDLAMPRLNGFEFRREQLADADLASIPVTVISAAGFYFEAEARKLGMTRFLCKPPSPDDLLQAIEQDCAVRLSMLDASPTAGVPGTTFKSTS